MITNQHSGKSERPLSRPRRAVGVEACPLLASRRGNRRRPYSALGVFSFPRGRALNPHVMSPTDNDLRCLFRRPDDCAVAQEGLCGGGVPAGWKGAGHVAMRHLLVQCITALTRTRGASALSSSGPA
eukprot:TRINITY_DN75560_c0_g1_i1.p1 TRINITY_DN75560_c0_g1~~TRINITY_DN75560_c0_g1_i1.p1  ORF type:complete len:127 (+),score=9.53 TRINITY_DN75560_c0_g1_i1:253-633(+)